MEQDNKQLPVEEQEIDLLELARKVWADRKLVLKWCGIAAVVGLVVAFSIPKEYTTNVTIAPESTSGSRSMGGLSALAGMAGINLNAGSSADALSPDLYPDIVSSVAFTTELFDVPVRDADGELQTTVYDYLQEHQRSPWWSAVISLPFKCIGWTVSLFSGDEEEADSTATVNPFQLTKRKRDCQSSQQPHCRKCGQEIAHRIHCCHHAGSAHFCHAHRYSHAEAAGLHH